MNEFKTIYTLEFQHQKCIMSSSIHPSEIYAHTVINVRHLYVINMSPKRHPSKFFFPPPSNWPSISFSQKCVNTVSPSNSLLHFSQILSLNLLQYLHTTRTSTHATPRTFPSRIHILSLADHASHWAKFISCFPHACVRGEAIELGDVQGKTW